MIRVKHNEDLSMYSLILNDLKFGDGTAIAMKFDTGAVSTVIGIRTLFKYLSENELDLLLNMFENSGIEKVSFNSASGGELWGYPCVVHDVMLSNTVIDTFCFYVIVNTNRNIALLGDDFISCCTFKHEAYNDIVIDSCSHESACERFKSKSNFKVLELDEVVLSLDYKREVKNIAAGFRELHINKSTSES